VTPNRLVRRFTVKRQPRLLDVSQRDATLDLVFPSGSSTATSDPSSPSTAMILPSIRPPCAGVSTFAHRPRTDATRPDCAAGARRATRLATQYAGDTSSEPSSRASSARETRAQSSTVTAAPSRRSIRASISGRFRVPPRRSSIRSYPTESSSATTTLPARPSHAVEAVVQNKKMWGASPTFHSRSRESRSTVNLEVR
jgi:hypothetical protein